MHLKNFARAWAASALVAVGLMSGGQSASAQDKKDPVPPPMAKADPTGAIPVTLGSQVRFQMASKKQIKEVFVENDRVVQVLPDAGGRDAVILIGRTFGTSRIELTDVDGKKETYLVVLDTDEEGRRKRAIEQLRELIRKTVPTATVEVTPVVQLLGTGQATQRADDQAVDRPTSVILSGYTSQEADRDTIEALARALGLRVAVNTISVGAGGLVPHVQLDVTLARVDRSRARSRGANFIVNGSTVSAGSLLGGLTSIQSAAGATGGGGGVGAQAVGAIPTAATAVTGGAANLVLGIIPAQFNLVLSALKSEGLAKLVAAPTIVSRSGEPAVLNVGQDVPVISQSSGITGPGVSYRSIGTTLGFTPIVYGNGKIHLTISPEVLSVNNAQALVTTFGTSPAFDSVRMTTSIIVEPGQTVAIGGLIQTTSQGSVTKIPHLGDIPYLGTLFSFNTQTETETELVILVTPRLIDPADCGQLPKALPGSETRKPDDFEFYLETMLEAPRGQRPVFENGRYVPAWKSSPTAATFPCAGGAAGAGCATGGCATPAAGKVIVTPPAAHPLDMPPLTSADPVAPPAALLAPTAPERKTAGLPVK